MDLQIGVPADIEDLKPLRETLVSHPGKDSVILLLGGSEWRLGPDIRVKADLDLQAALRGVLGRCEHVVEGKQLCALPRGHEPVEGHF